MPDYSQSVQQAPSDQRVPDLIAASRRLGADRSLVLHGGGNTSVKCEVIDVTGAAIPILAIKGSGSDLATIEPHDLALLRLGRLRELLGAELLNDRGLRSELRAALVDPFGPDPSVETLVHAALPHTFILHSHPDTVLALTDSTGAKQRCREVFGDDVLLLDYCMPGVDLARAVRDGWQTSGSDALIGLVVVGHGVFAFGESAGVALARHDEIISRAHAALPSTVEAADAPTAANAVDPLTLARLRSEISTAAGRPMILTRRSGPAITDFVSHSALLDAASRGPASPDHAVWAGPFPLVGTDVRQYSDRYRAYFEANKDRRGAQPTMTDPAPRVVLDPELGLLGSGPTVEAAGRAADIAEHTLGIIQRAEALGGYRPPTPSHVFDLEYWEYQQGKTRRAADPKPLAGQVAVVTGAASGIGRACALALLDAGAAVAGWDLSESVRTTVDSPRWLGQQLDVTDESAQRQAISEIVERYGGIDIVVPAAGIFPSSAPLGELDRRSWDRTFAVNVTSVEILFGLVQPYLAMSPAGGKVAVIASKNVAAPGPGAAAYSGSKAALVQLCRVAALEWAEHGVIVNMVHPDAVFDTGLWTPELLAARAEHYGMTIDQYKRRNLLHTEVTSAAVGRMIVAMVDGTFACSTGAQIPIDGGNDRVI